MHSQNFISYYHTFTHHTNLRMVLSSSKKNKEGFDWWCAQFINWHFYNIKNSYSQKIINFSMIFMFFSKVLWLSSNRFYSLLACSQVFYPFCWCYEWEIFLLQRGKHVQAQTFTLYPATPVTIFDSNNFQMILWVYYLYC